MESAPFGARRHERLAFGLGQLTSVPTRQSAAATAAALAHEAGPVRLLRIDTWDWGWGGLLLFSTLMFLRPQDEISLLGQAHLSDISAIIGLIGMMAVNLGRRGPLFHVTPEAIGVALLGAVILASVPFSIWPGGSVAVFTQSFMQITLIFLLMVNAITSPKRVNRICWIIVLAFGYISARVCFDYLRGVNLVEGNRAAGPTDGFFGNPNDLALNLVAFLPLALMYARHGTSWAARAASAATVALMLTALVFTKSRGGFIALVVMLPVYLVMSRMLTPRNIIALVLGGMVLLPTVPSSFWNRMVSITDASQDPTGSRQERIELMQQAWRVFQEHPLTGIGAGQFQNYQEPGQVQHWRVTHNTPLQLAAEVGIVGVVVMLFLIARGIGAAWWTRRALRFRAGGRRRRSAPEDGDDFLTPQERTLLEMQANAMIACLVGWFVAAMFASVAYNWTFYFLLGLSVTARDVVRARMRAHAEARRLGVSKVVAA